MKPTPIKAIIALCVTGILGGFAPIFMKVAFKEFSPVQVVFTRFFFTSLILFPIALFTKKLTFEKKDIPVVLLASLLFSGNIFLFVFGLQYTTSIASQLVYLLTPTFVIILTYLFFKSSISSKYFFSIFFGLFGGIILVSGNNLSQITNSLGTPLGNGMILGGVCSWSCYIIVSKRLSNKYNPLSLIVANSSVITIISALILYTQRIHIFSSYFSASSPALLSLLFLVIFNSILFFFLYQWAIKLASPFAVSLSTYLSPLAAGLLAIPLFGEKITIQLVMSAILIGISSYLTFKREKIRGKKL